MNVTTTDTPVAVTFRLSPAGQRDAIARGLPPADRQTREVGCTAELLPLCTVDSSGALSLNLYPQWDTYPTDEELTQFAVQRAATEAAEKAEQEAKRLVQRDEQARMEQEAEAIYASWDMDARIAALKYDGAVVRVGTTDICLLWKVSIVAEARAEKDRRSQAEQAAKDRRKAIPGSPRADRAVELQSDGTFQLTVPDGDWAKYVQTVDPSQRGGYAFDGLWLKPGEQGTAHAGDIMAVGDKRWEGSRRSGRYVTSLRVYVVTPVRLALLPGDGAVKVAAAALAMPPAERVRQGLQELIDLANFNLAKFTALEPCEEDREIVSERRTEWEAIKVEAEKALAGADPESNIADVDAAALAIVTAGYRALAKRHHPDAGGDVVTMALINTAKAQLSELLVLAAKGVKP